MRQLHLSGRLLYFHNIWLQFLDVNAVTVQWGIATRRCAQFRSKPAGLAGRNDRNGAKVVLSALLGHCRTRSMIVGNEAKAVVTLGAPVGLC